MSDRHITPGSEWAWRDLLFGMMVAFMALAVVALAAIPQDSQGQPPGLMVVTLGWDRARDIDVDLWVQSPDDAPVGYSRRTGAAFDLLHDHRGAHVEGNFDNMELASARSLPAGRYVVNAAAFSTWDSVFPVHVWVTVDRIDPATRKSERLFRREADLLKVNDEITLISFRLDDAGHVVPGSDNNMQVCLWRTC